MFFATSGNALIMVIVGGVGTLVGALYGAALLTLLKSIIGSLTEHHLIVIGLIFIGAILFMPKGLIGVVKPAVQGRLTRRARKHAHLPLTARREGD